MRVTAAVKWCKDTGTFVGYITGFAGAHSQGRTLDELNRNLVEVIGMLLKDRDLHLETEYVGIQQCAKYVTLPNC
ncbi:MAG: type II toxin-antitoxin system HicB family antitoxin [Gemmatimonadota bacterium]|nr:type II toxin-antitoxin system HicB family antitoxin [Gemmatimonadota bacterium]